MNTASKLENYSQEHTQSALETSHTSIDLIQTYLGEPSCQEVGEDTRIRDESKLYVVQQYLVGNDLQVYLCLEDDATTGTQDSTKKTGKFGLTPPPSFPLVAVEQMLAKENTADTASDSQTKKVERAWYIDCLPEGINSPNAPQEDQHIHYVGARVAGYYNSPDHNNSDTTDSHFATDHHIDFSQFQKSEKLTSALLYFPHWLTKKWMDKPACITHLDPDTVLTVALAADLVPVKHIKSVIDASRVADYGEGSSGKSSLVAEILQGSCND